MIKRGLDKAQDNSGNYSYTLRECSTLTLLFTSKRENYDNYIDNTYLIC